jgi:hypothetical protein
MKIILYTKITAFFIDNVKHRGFKRAGEFVYSKAIQIKIQLKEINKAA